MEEKRPGVVTGLAWTSAGGEILFIETLLVPGSGKVQVTGQLGDVMKESVQIALSLVKSMYPKEAEILKDHDLHIHVPAGAVPKDGPSAGITMTSARVSSDSKGSQPGICHDGRSLSAGHGDADRRTAGKIDGSAARWDFKSADPESECGRSGRSGR